jgi:FlaA1/EpsC-like NDP-sugar epimerase
MNIPHSTILRLRRYRLIAVQLVLVVAANRAAFLLRFDGREPAWAVTAWLQMLPWLVGLRATSFAPFRLYQGRWRYTSVYELKAIVESVALSSLLFAAVASSPLGPPVYPRSIFVIDAILLVIALGSVRVARRLYADFSTRSLGKRLLVIGAGDAGEMLVRDIRVSRDHHYQVVGFIDDDPTKVGHRIHDVPVLGTRQDLQRILTAQRPDEVLIAIPSADPSLLRAIVRSLEPHNIPIKTLPQLRDLMSGRVELRQIRTLGFEDLLSRAPVGLDQAPLNRLIAGRRVLVTGAGGSIGGELCRQIAAMAPASLVMLDRYENGLHALHVELQDRPHAAAFHQVIGDVTDITRVNAVFKQYQPEIVFHAAAHKHVPLMEDNPCEAVKNNVTGSRIVAEAAERHGVGRFILISTDKAVNPVSVMGASKRLAELVVQARAMGSATTIFATVRFGNVLGSNGSVVPRFLDQIRKGGPVTVTHPEVRRFFMLIPEAVQLVLHAAAQADNGATYVLEMGEQVKLVDMARHLIRLSGFVPENDIAIEFVGLRPGEKLSEELVGDDETARRSRIDKILRVSTRDWPTADVLMSIRAIEERASESDAESVAALLGRLLTAYRLARPDTIPTLPEPVVEWTSQSAAEPAIDSFAPVAMACPKCRSGHVYRLHARTLFERAVRAVGERRLFACDECSWRGWLVPVDIGVAASDTSLMKPDLCEIDAAFSLTPFFPQRTPPGSLN